MCGTAEISTAIFKRLLCNFRCSPDTSDTPRVGDANRECGKTAGLVLPA